LAVDSKFHGQGIGSMLLNYLESICILRHINKIQVTTQLVNESAIFLYRKVGYVESDRKYVYHAHTL